MSISTIKDVNDSMVLFPFRNTKN